LELGEEGSPVQANGKGPTGQRSLVWQASFGFLELVRIELMLFQQIIEISPIFAG
jgi:hypothetical protein